MDFLLTLVVYEEAFGYVMEIAQAQLPCFGGRVFLEYFKTSQQVNIPNLCIQCT